MSIVNHEQQAQAQQLVDRPPGPDTLHGLFKWHEDNAAILMQDAELKGIFLNNLASQNTHLDLVESFSGLGTAGVTLKMQFSSLQRHARGGGGASV